MNSTKPPINQRDTLPVGYDLHWYKLLEVIGRGGYGITYLAIDKNLDRKVAIKEYLPMDFAHREANDTVHPMTDGHKELFDWGLQRFLVEARTLAKFNHPSIIRVLSVFEHNKTAYMVMDYEEGDDLAAVYKQRKSFSEQELLNLFVPVIEGLADVHETGFIHRDVKPSNIYIRTDGSSVLLDFGSARQTLGNRTRALTSLVTAGYAPFEQYNESEEQQGPWTDIYGLGATLYYCITGKKPTDALERGSRLLRTGKDIYEPLNPAQYPGYSAAFLHAIDRALMFQPEDRPQRADEWVDMLTGKVDPAMINQPATVHKMAEKPANDEHTIIRQAPPSKSKTKAKAKVQESKSNESIIADSAAKNIAKETLSAPVDSAPVDSAPVDSAPVDSAPADRAPAKGTPAKSSSIKSTPAKSTAENKPATVSDTTMLSEQKHEEQIAADTTKLDIDAANHRTRKPVANSQQPKAPSEPVNANENKQPAKPIISKKAIAQAIAPIVYKFQQNKTVSSIAAALLVVVVLVSAFATFDDEQTTPPAKTVSSETPVLVERTPAQQVAVARQELITGLLTQARMDVASKRYVEPPENNAVYRYRKILSLHPENQAALNGLHDIADHYLEKIEANINAGDWKTVEQELIILRHLPIEVAELKQLQGRFNHYNKQQALINSLLTKAENNLKKNKLTRPKNNNALYFFNKVLKEDEENQRAKEGLQQIVVKLSDVLSKQIEANKIKNAEKTFNLIESIDQDAPVLATAESTFSDIYKTRKQIRGLLASADKDFLRGRVITPKGNNAVSKYRKVLKLSPRNKKAKEGLEVIFQYYLSSFTQFLNEEKFEKASEEVTILRSIGYDRKRVADLNNTIEKEKLALKNEPKTIQNILSQLKTGIQKRDAQKIKKMSVFKNKKREYLDSLFEKYSNISVDVRQQSHDKRKHQAYALIKIKGTTEEDREYATESKLDIDILVRKEKDKQWKVIW